MQECSTRSIGQWALEGTICAAHLSNAVAAGVLQGLSCLLSLLSAHLCRLHPPAPFLSTRTPTWVLDLHLSHLPVQLGGDKGHGIALYCVTICSHCSDVLICFQLWYAGVLDENVSARPLPTVDTGSWQMHWQA